MGRRGRQGAPPGERGARGRQTQRRREVPPSRRRGAARGGPGLAVRRAGTARARGAVGPPQQEGGARRREAGRPRGAGVPGAPRRARAVELGGAAGEDAEGGVPTAEGGVAPGGLVDGAGAEERGGARGRGGGARGEAAEGRKAPGEKARSLGAVARLDRVVRVIQ